MARVPFVGLTGGTGSGQVDRARRARAARRGDAVDRRGRPRAVRDATRCATRVVARWGDEVAPAASSTARRSPRTRSPTPEERAWLEGELWPRVARARRGVARGGRRARAAAGRRGRRDAAAVRGRDGGRSTTRRSRSSPTRTCAPQRAAARGHVGVDERAARQLSQEEKARRATYTVHNSGYGGGARARAVRRARETERHRERPPRHPARRHAGRRSRTAPCAAAGGAACAALLGVALLAALLAAVVVPRLPDVVRELALPLRHEDIIRQQADDKGLDPSLLAAVIYAESTFRDQTSHAGARGLMQITPETARYIAHAVGRHGVRAGRPRRRRRSTSPTASTTCATCCAATTSNTVLALAAYNGGEGNVDRWLGEAACPSARSASSRSRSPRRASTSAACSTRARATARSTAASSACSPARAALEALSKCDPRLRAADGATIRERSVAPVSRASRERRATRYVASTRSLVRSVQTVGGQRAARAHRTARRAQDPRDYDWSRRSWQPADAVAAGVSEIASSAECRSCTPSRSQPELLFGPDARVVVVLFAGRSHRGRQLRGRRRMSSAGQNGSSGSGGSAAGGVA